jgi:hypothetical protein
VSGEELRFGALWAEAETFPDFLARAESQRTLWEGVYRTAAVPVWAVAAFGELSAGLRLLVLNADWCMDSANTVPLMARLAEAVPSVELRLLERDRYPEVMDRYLTNGGRSIPIAILLDRGFRELGRWGPRPAPLQAWVLANRKTIPMEGIIRGERRWYAMDKGETTLRELLDRVVAREQRAESGEPMV